MSVAAMTMDDQRPLMNSYDKMSTKYDQNLHMINNSSSSNNTVVAGSVAGGVGGSNGGAGVGAGPSGPASPTPSGSEELPSSHHHPHYHHHHHHATATQAQQTQEQQRHHLIQQQQQHQQQQEQQQQQHDAAVAEAAAAAEQRRLLEDEIENLKLEQTRLGLQCVDAQRREKILMRRLANKEQEFQDYVSQIAEYKAQQAPTALALRTALLDPAVNLLFERLKKELKATKAKLEETQNELSAWKFTPDSNTGKRLMAKCRLLYQENEELGKMTSNGRLAKLETELAMQKSFSEEVKKSQSELDDFLQELDEDVEGMQSTILFLQQELKTTRDRIQLLEKENSHLKQPSTGSSPKEVNDTLATTTTTATATNGQSINVNNTNDTNNQFEQSTSSSKLETIDENACLETTTTITTTTAVSVAAAATAGAASTAISADYFNGSNNEQQLVASELIMPDDGSNSNGSKNGAAARLARKRNYEEENTATATCVPEAPTVQVVREVSAPRTLPPKKSKLRGIPTRRGSQLEDEQQPLGLITTMPVVVDNAVAGMATEESTAASAMILDQATPLVVDASLGGTQPAAARILTRRRSVRMQQNGGNGVEY